MEIEIIEENGKEYYLVKKLSINNNTYCYFVNQYDIYDIFVRKLIEEDGKLYLVSLENKEELIEALKQYNKE